MEIRNLGKSGLKISSLSFGSWLTFGNNLDIKQATNLMKYAYDLGVNFFDNAEVYESGLSEKIMGKALSNLKLPRDTYIISSKAFWGGPKPTQKGLSRKHLVEACNNSLKRLNLDYLDLFYCHRPDQNTTIEETVWTMHNLIQQGKILYWGTSEWSALEIAMAHMVAKQYNLIPPTMEQPQYNMLERFKMENEYLRIFKEIGMGTTIWSPLASGLLTGKYSNGIPSKSRATLKGHKSLSERFQSKETEKNIKKIDKLQTIANELKISITQLAIGWCLQNPYVSSVILGATSLTQLKENIETINVYKKINSDIMNKIDKILDNKPPSIKIF